MTTAYLLPGIHGSSRGKSPTADTGSTLAGRYVIVAERLEYSELYWPLERLVEKEGGLLVVDCGNGA